MSDFDSMPIDLLTKLVGEDRVRLQASDAGTQRTHMNDAAVLAEKMVIARRLNHMAFCLSQRDGVAFEDFATIAAECRPYLAHAAIPVGESVHAS
jgi:hypothetical protein